MQSDHLERRATLRLHDMNDGVDEWSELLARLEPLLSSLLSAPAATRREHGPSIPAAPGLYLFEEDARPMYVGQTRNLRRRLADHCRLSGGHNKASFAFLIARRALAESGMQLAGTRSQLELHDGFGFPLAKQRVAQMKIRFVTCDDPELRTVFEVFAALRLQTPYNEFETH